MHEREELTIAWLHRSHVKVILCPAPTELVLESCMKRLITKLNLVIINALRLFTYFRQTRNCMICWVKMLTLFKLLPTFTSLNTTQNF